MKIKITDYGYGGLTPVEIKDKEITGFGYDGGRLYFDGDDRTFYVSTDFSVEIIKEGV